MAVVRSPFARHARKRLSRELARKRAPKHPPAPEAAMRRAMAKLFATYHERLIADVVRAARHYLPHRQDDSAESLIQKLAPSIVGSIFAEVWKFGKALLTPFQHILAEQARKTADSVKKQTALALDLGDDFDPDLDDPVEALADGLSGVASDLMEDGSEQRVRDILGEWEEFNPDRSPRAEDLDALEQMLEDGLDGIAGTALAAVAMHFGNAFSDMVEESQKDAGVASYMWLSQRDSKVRPAHLALDGQICSWDDPPLSAEDSDSGEECHAGEDFNCRCVASPIDEEDGLTERQQERVVN